MPYLDREKQREHARDYYVRNREKIRRATSGYYHSNLTEGRRTRKIWREKNREKLKAYFRVRNREKRCELAAYHRGYNASRRREDPDFRLREILRARVGLALRGKYKAAPTWELIGCSLPEFRFHLEAQFRPGMTWKNHGPVWHIDHRKPCAKFDLTDPAQQRECFNFKNLQPLFAEENFKKGAK